MAYARFGRRTGAGDVVCADLLRHPEALDEGGLWFVVADFQALADDGSARADGRAGDASRSEEATSAGARASAPGRIRAWRFTGDAGGTPRGGREVADVVRPWVGPEAASWVSSTDRAGYEDAVRAVRGHVQEGDVYQVNVCRVMSAPLPRREGREPDALALAHVLAAGNPAPYEGVLHVPAGLGVDPVWVVTASPELFLRVRDGRVTSGPIKGTATTAAGLSDKDRAENVMITDLVRNDLQRVCVAGTVEVETLLGVEEHPGLVHLVSTVSGTLTDADRVDWLGLLRATFPPASVSGAPKSSALRIIDALEPEPRGPYCGAVGWIDADAGTAELAVGIRTFWWAQDVLRFGTGAGITWGSDPAAEWEETELKARRLVGLASGAPAADCDA
ncbi:para-aminobenzoate synthetase component 1 [Sediminihabitans luteus]|uniref:Para-aminobenzoate synthetase component 1 n=1 Tax=Sediminihabitans luteus TaxID=1138585 RepID=A0A2M9CQC0_9CELL|nr:chorismate-binding protein [Sediminihabitans luteus]PJJ74130.1 para-aminobenzoate synthetase component 1 [Sediminihabitans luteus]